MCSELTIFCTPLLKLVGLPRVVTLTPLTMIVVGRGVKLCSCSTTWSHFEALMTGRLVLLPHVPLRVALEIVSMDTL